ncbi:LacI family transcriptional regulator [Pelagibius litoralis]|uniref:LacI family transcriptional regulator n=1 Tax=Pelagibius litoralis TaxID=374515 RepID=A0A967K6M7_9PROT|nr:LacI family DNA-binding transcriptional regulator [Pelagibius litoralis]NIA69343.1 LacI family transcriptional regulator [Pelagibius litoralis]
MSRRETTTLEDVARLAGVSPATVSRCMNQPQSVRAEKRVRIQGAIDQLGYVPNGSARALASRRSRMIGAILPSLDNMLFGGPLEAFQKEVGSAGYTVAVACSEYDQQHERVHIRNFLESPVDALLLVGGHRDPNIYRQIERQGIPYVLTWVSSGDREEHCVGFDNAAASADLVDYLVSLGHRRFGMISGFTEHNDRAGARLAGVRKALARHDLSLDDDQLLHRPFEPEAGRDAFHILMSGSKPPTVVICGAEPHAYGALFEARDMGIDVPGQVSVTGFDDMWLASQTMPTLTTIRTPREEMGRQAAHHLLAQLRGERVAAPRPLETTLVVRKSTAAPPEPFPGPTKGLKRGQG